MANVAITSTTDHTKSIYSILEQLITYLEVDTASLGSSKDVINRIDKFNRENNLLDYERTVFNVDYDEIISHEILKTYEHKNNTESRFSTVLQVCDCNNLNLLEHLWSAILLVDHIINRMNNDNQGNYFSFMEFQYYIFLNAGSGENKATLSLLNRLVELIRFERNIKFFPLTSDDQFDDILYDFRQENQFNKIDLLLLLDNSDVTNLKHLKVVETLGLIQPLSFIISTSGKLTYTRYVNYSPFEKNRALKKKINHGRHPGRWNLVYNTRCVRGGHCQGEHIELTRCLEYLDG